MFKAVSDHSDQLIKAFLETFEMVVFALIISIILGLVIGFILFFTRKDGLYENKYLYFIFSALVNVIRSVPFFLLIIILIPFNSFILKDIFNFSTGFGVQASKIPLSIIGIATFARFTEQAFLSADKNVYETSYALGASHYQYVRHFLMSESRSNLVLYITSTAISLTAYSTLMGVIGGGGLGHLAIKEGYQNFKYPLMWFIIIVMIIMVQLTQVLGNLVAKKLDKR